MKVCGQNTNAWEQRKLADVLSSYTDPVEIPHTGYERLGIRSHAKGTFHSYVPAGHELQTAQMHKVAADKFIVNITFGWEHAVAVTDENDAGKLVSHRFPQFSLSEELDPKFLKFIILDENFRHHLWLASPGGAGRNRVLNLTEMLQYEIYIPSVSEQRQIADVLIRLDNLITLHQRKYDRLKNVKKSMLEKMFPRDGANVPEIRFAGFTDAWGQRKFSELYAKVTEKNDLSFGADKIISVANMYFKEDTKESSDDYMKTYNVMRLGDIAFEGNRNKNYAHGRFVENTIGDGIVSHVFDVFRPIVDYDLNYWKYYINNEIVMGRTMARCTKSSTMMTNLVANDFLKEAVLVPVLEEQKKIGQYFSNLDNLITLHQRKLDTLKKLKQGMLQQMFI